MVDSTPQETADVPAENFDGYQIHPAANVFPMMPDEALEELAQDIATHGQREPVVLFQGKVLDGRNRLRACQIAGVKPKFVHLDVKEVDSPTSYVVSLNLHRRMLSASQRAAIALTLEHMFTEEARQRSIEGARKGGQIAAARRRGAPEPQFSAAEPETVTPVQPPAQAPPSPAVTHPAAASPAAASGSGTPDGSSRQTPAQIAAEALTPFGKATQSTRSRDRAAAAMGVSSGYVSQAKQIRDADPALLEEVAAGKTSLPEAKRRIFPTLSRIVKDEPVKAAPRKIRAPRRSGKVTSSRITLNLTVTFGSAKVAQKVLQVLDDDPRVLEMVHETLDDTPVESGDRNGN